MTLAFALAAAAASATLASARPAMRAQTLDSLCTSSNVASALPNGVILGATIDNSSLTVNSGTYNATTAEYAYCNVTFQYGHAAADTNVWVQYILPDPSNFKNRYLSTGGGGNAINSGEPTGGLAYGAVGGRTDGGFGGFSNQFDTNGVDVLANGTVNPWIINLFGYQAHHEMALLGKQFTRNFYGMDSGSSSSGAVDDSDVDYAPSYDKTNSTGTRLYSYYQACSEGGREGWSQLQRYGDQFDGAVVGAPAFRFAHQQVNHMFSAVAEQTIGYVPPPCEFNAIVNATIAFCDPLDGRTDGVISRSDLCLLKFDMKSIIGKSYYCAAQAANPNAHGPGGGALPEQSGKVTAKGVEVAQTIINGLKDSQGNQAYLSWAIGASFADATPSTLNNETGLWELPSVGIAATWIGRELLKLQVTDLATTDITYDHLVDWMYYGWQNYFSTLHTTWPDLTPLKNAGGKVIHYHGEADNSVPVGSSVHYYENVASTMYPGKSYKQAHAALGDWYRLYLIPGAAHCNTNTLMPNGPWPTDMLAQMIEWVEEGTVPTTLNATVTSGPYQGSQPICAWPLRPRWTSKTKMVCEYDQQSLNTWQYTFPAFKLPVW